MIYIDLPADLNLEDDQGRNVARLADAVTPDAVTPGAVLVVGAARAWSWAVVESVDSGFVYFRQISARDAARRGSLVKRFRSQPDPGTGYRSALMPVKAQALRRPNHSFARKGGSCLYGFASSFFFTT
jgi:hypothetical protein